MGGGGGQVGRWVALGEGKRLAHRVRGRKGRGMAEAGGENENSSRGAKQIGLFGWIQQPAHVVKECRAGEQRRRLVGRKQALQRMGQAQAAQTGRAAEGLSVP